MANDENLKRLTPSEAREYGKMGGKKSGEVRRRKANFRKTLNMLPSLLVPVIWFVVKSFLPI